MKRIRYSVVVCLFLLMVSIAAGCASKEENVLDPESPTVIVVWHAYNAFAKSVFDKKVTEFNERKGMELGIVVDAYGYGTEEELDKELFNSANQMIGSEALPDICSIYPESAYRLDALTPLVKLNQYFSEG